MQIVRITSSLLKPSGKATSSLLKITTPSRYFSAGNVGRGVRDRSRSPQDRKPGSPTTPTSVRSKYHPLKFQAWHSCSTFDDVQLTAFSRNPPIPISDLSIPIHLGFKTTPKLCKDDGNKMNTLAVSALECY